MGTIEKFIKAIFDITKIPSLLFLVFALTGTFIFYFNEYVIVSIDKKSNVYLYSYLLYCVSVAVVFISICSYIIKQIKYCYYYFKVRYDFRSDIKNLNDSEKAVLREFYIFNEFSLKLPYDNPTVAGLINKRILIPSSSFTDSILLNGNTSIYRIGDYTRKILDPIKDIGCIPYFDEANPNNTEEEIRDFYISKDKLISLRPSWVSRY